MSHWTRSWSRHEGSLSRATTTLALGTHSLTAVCTPTDPAAFTGSTSDAVSYVVNAAFPFDGFFQPVDNLPTVNSMKAGAGVPVKFSLGGDQGLNIFNSGSQQINCRTGDPIAPIEQTVTAGNSSLQYDPTIDRYTYVWKTDKAWKGTYRQLNLQLTDGTNHLANFMFN